MLVLGEFPLPRVLFILLSVLCGTRESEAWPGVLSCICHVHSSGSLQSVAMRSLSCLEGVLVVLEKQDLY